MRKYDKEFLKNIDTIFQIKMNSMQQDMFVDYLKRNDKKHESKANKSKEYPPKVEEVYKRYPDRCPVRNAPSGKNSKCKDKIVKLMELFSAHVIVKSIDSYINDCVNHKIYIKNFLTYLNSFEPVAVEEPKNSEDIVNYFLGGNVNTCKRAELPIGAVII